MSQKLLGEISQKNVRITFFIFFCLFVFSTAFFVLASDAASTKSIFEDSDQDGLSNDEESLYKTDPNNKDTDGDGYMDGVEVESGYDPLKHAPGDKLASVHGDQSNKDATQKVSNLTDNFSTEIASLVQSGSGTGDAITLENVNSAVQKVLSEADTEIVLPDVSLDEIKIKKLPKNLSGKDKKEKEKDAVVEYLTVMAYILANNSPKTFHSENDLGSLLTSLSTDSLSALALGNTDSIDKLSEKGEKTLKEIKDVEVPEAMIDVHVKALKMAKYMVELKDDVKKHNNKEDPIGQIASLSKVQGFLGVVTDFGQEVFQKLSDYGIQEIPIDL